MQQITARVTSREGQKSQLVQRVGQLQSKIEGMRLSRNAKDHEKKLIADELIGVRSLLQKRPIWLTGVNALRRTLDPGPPWLGCSGAAC